MNKLVLVAAAAAIYASGAVAALALAFTLALDKGWLTVALALMVPGIAWVEKRRPFTFLRILAAAATLLGAKPGADFAAEGTRWWAHIQFLADDKLEGRNTGSEGYRKAVEYVQGQFEKFGLKPGGTDGYLQPIKFDTRQLVEKDSTIELVRDGNAEQLKLGEETSLSPRADSTAQPRPALSKF